MIGECRQAGGRRLPALTWPTMYSTSAPLYPASNYLQPGEARLEIARYMIEPVGRAMYGDRTMLLVGSHPHAAAECPL